MKKRTAAPNARPKISGDVIRVILNLIRLLAMRRNCQRLRKRNPLCSAQNVKFDLRDENEFGIEIPCAWTFKS